MDRSFFKLWPVAVVVVGMIIQGARAEIRLSVLESSYAQHVQTVDGDLNELKTLLLRICDKVAGGPECRIRD